MANETLGKARKEKNDEFYTQLTDIEKELIHYRSHFKDKVVYLNCDDPVESNFWQYFALNFEFLELKKLVATHFDAEEPTYKLELNAYGKEPLKTKLAQNGDFRSNESIELLKEADIVVTNPPFSLFREYVAQLVKYEKKFLIMGNNNAITYKEIFPLIQENKMWLGVNSNKTMEFRLPEHYTKWKCLDFKGRKLGNVPAISWFTNLEHNKRSEIFVPHTEYLPELHPTYDNYDAIEVSKVVNIPADYEGIMGVPITFLTKYNPDQFDIVWQASGNTRASAPESILQELDYSKHVEDRGGCGIVNGKRVYSRILIRHKRG